MINNINFGAPGTVGVVPRTVKIETTATLSEVTALNFLESSIAQGSTYYPTDMFEVAYSTGTGLFVPTISASGIQLNSYQALGNVTLPVTSGHLASFDGTTGEIKDSAIASTSVVVISKNAGQTISATTASATPGTIRSVTGAMTGTNTTMTSGNLVGVRGSVTCVGASGGFLYGAQGKIISTGTLSGSSWTAGVFGQLDISAATINAGQTACIWGDYGTTSGTITSATGMRGIAMTNTTAAVLNAQDYRYGNATYLFELAGAGGTLDYYLAAGTSAGSAGDATHCAAQKVIRWQVNGVAGYIPFFTQNT